MKQPLKRAYVQRLAGLIAGLAIAMAAPAMADPQEQGVSSDGVELALPDYLASVRATSSYSGTGASADLSSTSSAAEMGRLLALKGVSAPGDSPESIIGPDNRFLISPTTGFPARAVVLITFSAGRCTGWMVSKDTVATAGHCVSNGSGSFYPISSFKIYPGRNGASSPFGFCTARRLHTVNGWHISGSPSHDFGAIKLNCTVGNTVGWFGFGTVGNVLNFFNRVSGYPGDKPLTQWQSTDRIRAQTTFRLFYQNDTVGGNSGGPAWRINSPSASFNCSGACGMAIHAYGANSAGNNGGTRFTSVKFNLLQNWRLAP